MGILNVSFYLKFRNNGSALISVLILLGFVSSLLVILLNVGKQDQEQIGQYQKNNIIYTHIHAVEDLAINLLNIDFQNSPNMTYQNENWGNSIEPFSVGSYTVNLKISDLQSKINVNSLVLNNSDINYIQLERLMSLFDQLDINQDLIYALIDWIDYDSNPRAYGLEDYYYSGPLNNPKEYTGKRLFISVNELKGIPAIRKIDWNIINNNFCAHQQNENFSFNINKRLKFKNLTVTSKILVDEIEYYKPFIFDEVVTNFDEVKEKSSIELIDGFL